MTIDKKRIYELIELAKEVSTAYYGQSAIDSIVARNKEKDEEILKPLMEALKGLDPIEDIVPLFIVHKVFRAWLPEFPEFKAELSRLLGKEVSGKVSSTDFYKVIKGHKDVQILVDFFAEEMTDNLTSWGFTILKDYDIKLVPKV